MANDASIYVYGNLIVNGTIDDPVIIEPNNNVAALRWGAICFDHATGKSVLNNLVINKATMAEDAKKYFANITSYNSCLEIDNVTISSIDQPFYSEYGDIVIRNSHIHSEIPGDLINAKYADSVLIENCTLIGSKGTDADAIDIDNTTNGTIRNNYISGFFGFNSDGIDLGENAKDILIENNIIFNCMDKGISIGQASTAIVVNNVIVNCAQGVGIKDFDSYAYIDRNTFYGNHYSVACFVKNFGQGGGNADVVNSIFSNSLVAPYLLDALSTLNISYSISDTDVLSGENNLNFDPLFINPFINNFELSENSPCIDSGDPDSPLDLDGTIADMGALFSYQQANESAIIINEINYNSSPDLISGDWLELYNKSNEPVDLSGWVFMDSENDHIFNIPDGYILDSESYVVLCNNDTNFRQIYPETYNYLGNFLFGLGNNGEAIRLFDENMQIVDVVAYDDVDPWPGSADGEGSSLELIETSLDNSIAENWRASFYPGGSPGATNNPDVIADFSIEKGNECSGIIQLNILTTTTFDSVIWDFDDGNVSAETEPIHYYTDAGTYSIQLTIFSLFGTGQALKNITFENILIPPIVYSDTICESGSVTLSATGSDNIFWYDDEFEGDLLAVNNTFTTPVLTNTTLYYASNAIDSSCESRRIEAIAGVIRHNALFGFNVDQNIVSFYDHSRDADNYLWDFGDGNISTEEEPVHKYLNTGTYEVNLYTENLYCNSIDSTTKNVTITTLDITQVSVEKVYHIYPNPATNEVNIYIQNAYMKEVYIELINLYGQLINKDHYTSEQNELFVQFDVSNLPAGIYFVRINIDNNITVEKIIIQ